MTTTTLRPEPRDNASPFITREASSLGWRPWEWPELVTVGGMTYRRGVYHFRDDDLTHVEYDDVDGSGATLTVWND